MAIRNAALAALQQMVVESNKRYTKKAELEALKTTVEGIIATGGEANVLEGVKINGTALAIAEKMVNLLITSGSANGTLAVNGVDIAVKGLAALAYKSQISESDLDDALTAIISAKASAADVTALQTAVNTLNASSTTEGSVAYQIAQIVAGADESYNTLKEVADWIASHSTDASAMNSKIKTNTDNIAALTALIGTLPENATATTVIGYISEVVAAIDLSEYVKISDLQEIMATEVTTIWEAAD